MFTLLIGYILIGILFYIEYRYESPRASTMLQTSGDDQGTTTLLFGVWIMALVSGVLWSLVGLGDMDTTITVNWLLTWLGLAWIIGGIVMLRWAIHVNAFYLRPLATTDDQYLCTDGPYKVIRHPGYLAFYLAWVGFGLASGNWVALVMIVLVMGYAYIRRIQAEEQMMLEQFGVDYQQYASESFRILPFIY
ncbi:uncharacterized protein BX664DRAFT_287897 [Halteromyces radiatus]|uniref:uncharacterized protein n=1 Tax=Halteromyces radiatus TaxID=101107 RepID=UPI00222105AF|nr:uncharacterized protein BX664DRAFT_287897 [Halteromyces radiatus]KAI8076354.1 hypothetical protein BX664DRAFT_287897 [Halteromyces radiatus]